MIVADDFVAQCQRKIRKQELEIEYLRKQLDELKKYFTSTNDIPVERATILAKDFWRIIGETE